MLKGSLKYPSMGVGVQCFREKEWFANRPKRLVWLHERLRKLDLLGKRDEYEECCWEVEEILVRRGELIYRG